MRFHVHLLCVPLALLALSWCVPQAPAERTLVHQVWLDRLPEDTTEPWRAYYFHMDGRSLVTDGASSYKMTVELFDFEEDGQTVSFQFPHDGRRATSAYKIEAMKTPTRHLDTMLTLSADPSNGNRQTVYFTGPELRDAGSSPLPHSQIHD